MVKYEKNKFISSPKQLFCGNNSQEAMMQVASDEKNVGVQHLDGIPIFPF